MAKVTSKLQVTVPRALADQFGISPGDEIEWRAAGDAIRVVPMKRRRGEDPRARVRLFDRATARQGARDAAHPPAKAGSRGWARGDLYDRDRSR